MKDLLNQTKLLSVSLALIMLCGHSTAGAQINSGFANQSASEQIRADACEVARNFPHDQMQIFESPIRVAQKRKNLILVVPFVVAGALIPADRHIEPNPGMGVQNAAQDISSVGLFGTAATIGGLYLYGVAKHDDHAHEAGRLGTQSFVDTLLVQEMTNLIAGRLRPFEGNGNGDFFANNAFGSSFPSAHASLSWSMSTVLAEEYPSTKSRLFWYSVASTIAVSRVVGRQHFASDVIVGSAMGYLVGHYVFRAHHHTD